MTPGIKLASGGPESQGSGSGKVGVRFVLAVWVSFLHRSFMLLLSSCGERVRIDAIFDLAPLDEAL